MAINRLGFATKGEAEMKAAVLRKLFKLHTRVVERKGGFWGVRCSFDPLLLKGD